MGTEAASHGKPLFVQRRSFDGSHAHAATSHTYAVLAYHLGGATRMEQRGQWTLGRGDVQIIPAGEPHRLMNAAESELWGVGVCTSCLIAEGAGAAGLLVVFERVRGGASAVVHIPEARQGWFEGLLGELQVATERADEAGVRVQRSLLTLIVDEVGRAFAPDQVAASDGVVADSLRFIERHCLAPLTLKAVAAAVRRSPAYVTTALRRATGRSAVQWIVAGRLAEARRRLLHSDEMVEVIAERVGYADATQFIRMFRREHGVTPAVWRAQQRPRSAG